VISETCFGEIRRFELGRTILGRGGYWTVAYWVDGLLVDTGCAHTAFEFRRALEDKPIHRILLTHTHEDHIGGASILQRERKGLPISAHPLGLPVLEDPRGRQPLQAYRRIFWGWPEECWGEGVGDGALIHTEHHTFEVVYTAGHSPDHICLLERRLGWLFSGDLYAGGLDRALRADCDIWGIIASLERAAALPAQVLFPGCARVREDAQAALGAKITYLVQLGERVQQLARQGWSVPRIAGTLLGGPMLVEFLTTGHFSRRNLVLSYLATAAKTGGGKAGARRPGSLA
jgi:glyoxylase-like metal-dependent hydrolase (beta-lactamase superfamily II)